MCVCKKDAWKILGGRKDSVLQSYEDFVASKIVF